MSHHDVDISAQVFRTAYDVLNTRLSGYMHDVLLEVLNLVTRSTPLFLV